jgi:hypothetical protein
MKKTLALILALMMVLTLALASCGEKPEETEPTDDFFNVGGDNTEEGDATGEGDETGKTNGGSNTSSTGYTAVNDTIYARFDAVLREDDKASSKKVAEIGFGTALQRVEKSKKWSKVTYNGSTAYIANDLITENKNAITFNAGAESTTAKIKVGKDSTLNIRKYPLALTAPTVIDLATFNSASIVGKVADSADVTILSISADGLWAKIECQGYAMNSVGEFATELSTLTGYCYLSYTTYGSGSTGSAGGNHLG